MKPTANEYDQLMAYLHRGVTRCISAGEFIESLHPHEPPDDPRYPVPCVIWTRWERWFRDHPGMNVPCLALREVALGDSFDERRSVYLAVPVPPPWGHRNPEQDIDPENNGIYWMRWWKRVRCYLAFMGACSQSNEWPDVEFDPLPFFDHGHVYTEDSVHA